MQSIRFAALAVAAMFTQAFAQDDPAAVVAKVQGLMQQGRFQEGYDAAVNGLQAVERSSKDEVAIALILNHVGLAAHSLGRYLEAEAVYNRAIRILEPRTAERLFLSRVLHNLASLYLEHRGRYAQAERLMRRVLDIGAAILPPDDPDLAAILANLGAAHMMQRHDKQAEVFFTRALAILERSSAEHRSNAAAVLSNLGVLRAGERDWDGAEHFFSRSVAAYEQTLGPSHPELVKPLVNLGRANLARNRPQLAEDPLRRATELAATAGSGHPLLREALVTYAFALQKLGRKLQSREVSARAKALGASSADLTVHISDLIR